MRTLSDLISDIKYEINRIPVQNAAVLTVLGHEIAEQAKSMIGTKQIFWKDLAQSTIDTKSRKHQGKNGDPASPLYATGDFQRSIEYTLVGSNKVRIFSDDPSAIYHELGTVNQVPRPVFKPAAMIILRKFLHNQTINKFYLRTLR